MATGRFRKRESIQAFKGTKLGTLETWQYYPSKQLLLTQDYKLGADILGRKEECADELHKPLTSFSILPKGGPLDLRRVEIGNPYAGGGGNIDYRYGSVGWVYSGGFICGKIPSGPSLAVPASSAPEAASYGPQAWNKFRPGRPSVNMGVFLGELRDLPRMLKDTCGRLKDIYRGLKGLGKNPMGLPYELVAKRGGKQAAQDYLSYQFGWAPFVSDLIKAYELSNKIDRNLREIRANNGKVRRRGGVLVNTSDSVIEFNGTDYGAFYPVLPTQMYATAPRYVRTKVTSKHIWFKGAFRYWIPDTGSLQWERNTVRKMYGLTFNAEVAWNLIPWSWLADWFGNIGDNIASFDNGWADNLTAKYAYVMAHDVVSVHHTCNAVFSTGGSLSCDTTVEYHSKARVVSSPYGFDVSFDSLNGRRLAILAALGMTRSRGRAFFP